LPEAEASGALQHEPNVAEITPAGGFFLHPEVDDATVAPGEAEVVVRVDLKQQSPVLGGRAEGRVASVST
jgi:hypothetical protein